MSKAEMKDVCHTVDVEHHLPHGRPDRLMEAEPHLSASTQRMIVALRRGKEGAAHGGVPADGTSTIAKTVKHKSHGEKKRVQ